MQTQDDGKTRYVSTSIVQRYALSDADLNKIVAAISEMDFAKWAIAQMEQQSAKAPPTAAPNATTPAKPAGFAAPIVEPGGQYQQPEESLPETYSAATIDAIGALAERYARAGIFKTFDELALEVGKPVERYAKEKAADADAKARAIEARCAQNLRAGRYQKFDEIALELGM